MFVVISMNDNLTYSKIQEEHTYAEHLRAG